MCPTSIAIQATALSHVQGFFVSNPPIFHPTPQEPTMTLSILFAILCAFGAIAYGVLSRSSILAMPDGSDKMQEIAQAIQEGAEAY